MLIVLLAILNQEQQLVVRQLQRKMLLEEVLQHSDMEIETVEVLMAIGREQQLEE